MKFGYARVSSDGQNLDRQIAALEKAGCKRIFREKKSGKNLERPELNKLLSMIHIYDEVVVLDLNRLGRNNNDITNVMNEIRAKGATFRVLSLPTFDGIEDENLRMLLNNVIIEVYKYQSESVRQEIKTSQLQGIKLAKKRGVYKGRSKYYSKDSKNRTGQYMFMEINKRIESGYTNSEIANELGINRTTVWRIRKEINLG